MKGTEYKYAAFISYRHLEPDKAIAEELHRKLERFIIPSSISKEKKTIGKVFRDEEELPTSSDLGGDIEAALNGSEWLIVVCSPRFLESLWCMREVNYFIEQGRRSNILTILIEGEPSESFPRQLRFVEVDEQEIEKEPLAADVRASSIKDMKKKLKREILRLLAPMLGVSFDDLYQRAKRHVKRQIARICIASLFVLLIFGVIIGFQIIQTINANRLAAVQQIANYIAESDVFIREGQQRQAVILARQALELAQANQVYELEAHSALYRALLLFPNDGAYAWLEHNTNLYTAKFSPDSSRVAIKTVDETIIVWDTRYAKELFTVWPEKSRDGGDSHIFCFNDENELFVYEITHFVEKPQFLRKFGADGELIFRVDMDGYNFALVGLRRYSLYDVEMLYFPAADAILINDQVIPSSEYTAIAFCAQNGDLLYKENFPISDYHPLPGFEITGDYDEFLNSPYFDELAKAITIQPASDGKTIVLGHATTHSYAILCPEVIRGDKEAFHFRFIPSEYYLTARYLHDTYFLLGIDNNETGSICVYDCAVDNYYWLEELLPPAAEGKKFEHIILLNGNKPGEFFAGYNTTEVNRYYFDGENFSLLNKVVDVEKDSWSRTGIYGFGWANKADNTITYTTDYIADMRGRKVICHEGRLSYNEYAYVWSRYGISSENGIIMEYDNNAGLLFNLNINDEYIRYITEPRYQLEAPYVDMEKGVLIAENYDDDGFFFEIYDITGNQLVLRHKVYLPDTAWFHPFDSCSKPYFDLIHGKDSVVFLMPQDDGITVLCSFTYHDGVLELSEPIAGGFSAPWVVHVGDNDIIVQYESHILLHFERETLKLLAEIDIAELHGDWLKENSFMPWHIRNGPPNQKIILWPYNCWDVEIAWFFAVFDFVTMEYITKEQLGYLSGEADVLWSDSGDNAFAYCSFAGFSAFNSHTWEYIGVDIFPDDIIAIEKLGGNILAITTRDNTIRFYDMDNLEKLSEIGQNASPVRHIGYNNQTGLAVISRDIGFEIYDIKSGKPFSTQIKFPQKNTYRTTRKMYLSGDNNTIFYLSRTWSKGTAKHGKSVYWCDFYSRDFYSPGELLEMAKEYD